MQFVRNWRRAKPIICNRQRQCHTGLTESYRTEGSVYVHWPYCRQRCTYCNFVKFIPNPKFSWSLENEVLEDAMVRELNNILQNSHLTSIKSIYFGGGTPSLARPQLVEKVMEAVQKCCHVAENAEITLEVNPTAEETQKLTSFISAGVNRFSIGLQTLDNSHLRLFNRDHHVKEAMECIELSRKLLPGHVSVDLIFGRPGQTVERWKKELIDTLNICDNHLSLYQLTVERGTKLHQQVTSGQVVLPGDDAMAQLYETAVSLLSESGFTRYEVSNFARGDQAESAHNKMYWKSSQYVGIGPGAHSRVVLKNYSGIKSGTSNDNSKRNSHVEITDQHQCVKDILNGDICRAATVNAADPVSWLNEVRLKGTGNRSVKLQTRFDILLEYVASALRTREGIVPDVWKIFCPWKTHFELFGGGTLWLQENNLVEVSHEYMRATALGLNVLDSILPHLINVLDGEFTNSNIS